MRFFAKSFLAVLAGMFAAQVVWAQVPSYDEVGFKPYGSYDGSGVDNVNLDNLNVTVDVPLYSLPQRGRLALTYSLPFTNWQYQQTANNCSGYPHPACYYSISRSNGLTMGLTAIQQGVEVIAQNTDTGQQTSGYEDFTMNYTLKDSEGGQHVLLYENGIFRAADGSGWLFKPSGPNPDTPVATNPTTLSPAGVAIDAQGTQYNSPSGGATSSIQDADGNIINFNSGYDSFGRTIPNPRTLGSANVSSCPNLNAQYQAVTSAGSWTVPGPNGGSLTYIFCFTSVSIHTAFFPGGPLTGTYRDYHGTLGVLQSVVLPNGTYWGFVYDAANPQNNTSIGYGDLLQVILPTGGSISYVWQTAPICYPASPGGVTPESRTLVSRTVNPGNGLTSSTWNYGIGAVSSITPAIGTEYETVVFNPDGSQVVHGLTDFGTGGICSLYETATQYGTPVNGTMTLTKSTSTQYQSAVSYNPSTMPAPLPIKITTSWPNGQTSYSTTTYDTGYPAANLICFLPPGGPPWDCTFSTNVTLPLGKVVSTADYDFSGALLEQTATSYLWQSNSSYLSANLLDTPTQVTVSGPSGTAAQTNYAYDQSSQVGLIPTTGLPSNGYGTAPGTVFGHATTTTDWLNTGGSNPVTQTYWLETGKIDHVIDARNNSTSYTYDSTGDFPAHVVYPPTGSTVHQEWFAFDPNTGKTLYRTDQDGNGTDDPAHTTNYSYDSYASLIGETFPDGGSLSMNYNDYALPLTTTTTVVAAPDPSQVSNVLYDGLGRVSQQVSMYGTSTPIYTETTYDLMDRVASLTNPFYTTVDSTYGVASFTYDVLNRKLKQQNQDGTGESSAYSGSTVTFTDENNNQWLRTSDALGRLTEVLEPNGSSTSPSMETDYAYDALDDLLSVTQWGGPSGSSGARTRSFSYDSLGRLQWATNPETGTVGYTYDANGNLQSKTDARGVTASYSYDALNRLLSKTYSDNTTPWACYLYDTAANGVGLLAYEWTQAASVGSCSSSLPPSGGYLTARAIASPGQGYDSMGRLVGEQQFTPASVANGTSYPMAYAYDQSGNLISSTSGAEPPQMTLSRQTSSCPNGASFPSTFGFVYCYDSAGRLQSVTSNAGSAPVALFNAQGYAAPGELTNATYGGSALSLTRTYDSRLRITSETDVNNGTAPTSGNATVTITGAEQSY